MVNCLVVYFSQMGSTETIAKTISDTLRNRGWSVQVTNLARETPPSTKDYDVLGIGTPTFFFREPSLVNEYLQELPQLNGKPFFVFALYSIHIGDTGNDVRRILLEKKGHDIGYFKSRGTNYFPGYTRKGILFCSENPSKTELKKAKNFAEDIVGKYETGNQQMDEFDNSPPAIYRLESLASKRWFTDHLLSQTFSVDRDKCIQCGKCISACPTNNVHLNSKGFPHWGDDCILCLSCEIACPEEAISCILDSKLMNPIINYNLARGIENPEVEFKEL